MNNNNNNKSLKTFLLLLILLLLLSLTAATNSFTTKLKSLTPQGPPILLNQKTKAVIQGPYAEIEYIQTYNNPYNYALEVEFSFSKPENTIFHQFEAVFHNHTIVTQIFERKIAEDLIYRNKDTVKYSYQDSDVMQIHIGIIQEHENVEVRFSFLQPLEVIMNQFWSLNLQYPFIENPVSSSQGLNLQTMELQYLSKEWKIEIEIKSDQPFGYIHNPSHNIKPDLFKSRYHSAAWNTTVEPNKNFLIYFQSDKVESPLSIFATHPDYPNDYVLLINSILQLNKHLDPLQVQEFLNQGEKGLLQLKKQILEEDIQNAKGEFVFLVDCSYSMFGEKMASLRKALQTFLEILPKHSFFNIISFGSAYSLYNRESLPSTPFNLWKARAWVNLLDYDMGNANFFSALEETTRAPLMQGYPRTIILLTNEIQARSWDMRNFLKKNSHHTRICDVRIGPKASKNSMKEIEKAGKCTSELILDHEDMREKAVNVIRAAIAPYFEDIKFNIECFNAQNQLVFAEKGQQNFLARDEPFKKWIYLKDISQFDYCNVNISYLNITQELKINSFKKAENSTVYHKLAFKSIIEELLNNAPQWNVECTEKKVSELSARYQIFSDYVTFLAVLRENTIDSQKKKLPKVISADHLSLKPDYTPYNPESKALNDMFQLLKMKMWSEEPIQIMECFYVGFWVFFICGHLSRKNKLKEGSRKDNYDEIVRRLTHKTSS